MPPIFLSHAREDTGIAARIAGLLRDAGVPSLTARDVPPGVDYGAWLTETVAAAEGLVVLWSRAAAASAYAAREAELAIRAWAGDRLVLARLDDTELPRGLRDISAFDLGKGAAEIDRLIMFVIDHFPERSVPAPAARAVTAVPPPRRSGSRRFAPLLLIGLLAGVLGCALAVFLFQTGPHRSATTPALSPSGPAAPPAVKPGTPSGTIALAAIVGAAALGIVVLVVLRRRPAQVQAARATVPAQPLSEPDGGPTAPANPPAAAAAHQIFVSYSRRDRVVVDRIVEEMEGFGQRVWIDRQAGGHGGVRYAAPIVAAIRSCRTIALMCSENAFASDHVVREIYVAGDFKKPFIAFQLDESEIPDELLYFLSGFPRIPSTEADAAAIQSALARVLS